MIKKIFSNCKKVLPCVYDGALSVAEQIAKLFKRTDSLQKQIIKRVEKSTLPYDADKTYVYGTHGGGYELQVPLDKMHLPIGVNYGVIPQRGPNNVLYGNTEDVGNDGKKFVFGYAYINKRYFDEHAATPESVADLITNKRDIVEPDKIGGVGRVYAAIAKTPEEPKGKQAFFNISPTATQGGYVPQRTAEGQIELPNQTVFPPSLNQAMSRREMRKYLPSITGIPSYKDGAFDLALSVDAPVAGVTDGAVVRRSADGNIMGVYAGEPSPLISQGTADENYLGRFNFGSGAGVLEHIAGGYEWRLAKVDHKDEESGQWVVEKNGVAKHDEHGTLYSTAFVIADPNTPADSVVLGDTEQVLTEELARNYFTTSEIEVVSLWNSDWFGPQTNFNGVNDAALGNEHNAKIQVVDSTNFPTTATSQSTAYLTHIDYNLAIVDLYTRTLNESGEIVKLDIYKGIYLGNPQMLTSKAFKKVLLGSVEF